MQVTLEPDPARKIYQLKCWATHLQNLEHQKLFNLATNPKQHVKNINVRLDAITILEEHFKKVSKETSRADLLTDDDVEKLFNLLTNEDDFPILVDEKELVVEEVMHSQKHKAKKIVKRDIEENVAVLRGIAALLIVDFGMNTNKFSQIRPNFIDALKDILDNMLCEKDQIFVNEKNPEPSSYFIRFVEALYFTDKESARQFMLQFNVKETDFSFERRTKAS